MHIKCLTANSEEKRPLRRLWHRQDDNIKMNLIRNKISNVHWINLHQGKDLRGGKHMLNGQLNDQGT